MFLFADLHGLSRKAGPLLNGFFQFVGHGMIDRQVDVLDLHHLVRGDDDANVRRPLALPPPFPERQMVVAPISLATSNALSTLGLLPEPLTPITTSPGWHQF